MDPAREGGKPSIYILLLRAEILAKTQLGADTSTGVDTLSNIEANVDPVLVPSVTQLLVLAVGRQLELFKVLLVQSNYSRTWN